MSEEFPLFPLNTVLFPGGLLPLRIFEVRYIDMVSRCLRREEPFVVALIRSGSETGVAAGHEMIGVTAAIHDWESLPGGLLGVTALGLKKVRVVATEVQPNQLIMAHVERLSPEAALPLPQHLALLKDFLERILRELPLPYTQQLMALDDAGWVSDRLAELLPFPHRFKQQMLETPEPLLRCQIVRDELHKLELVP